MNTIEDMSQRFLFEHTDVRGDIVQIESSFQELIALHDYPPAVSRLLGEFAVASLLLASTIKFKGRLILQVRSQGQIPLLMIEVTHDNTYRGIARLQQDVTSEEFSELFADGNLVVTVDPDKGERYQSLVPLAGANLSECLMHYFAQSEQLKTWLLLTSDEQGAAGFLLQQLPMQLEQTEKARQASWDAIRGQGETLTVKALRSQTVKQILNQLYEDNSVRVMLKQPVSFSCSCSAQRMARAVVSLGEAELDGLYAEQSEIELTCEFCNQQYSFTRASLTQHAEA